MTDADNDRVVAALEAALGVTTACQLLMDAVKERDTDKAAMAMAIVRSADTVIFDALATPSSDAMYEQGVRDVLYIRCIDHREVPQYNRREINGGECAACAVEATQGKPRCIGCGRTEDELHAPDCTHINGVAASDARVAELERENAWLKRLIAEAPDAYERIKAALAEYRRALREAS